MSESKPFEEQPPFTPAEANKAQAQADLEALLAEREQVAATHDVADATGEFVERITALRSAVAGDITAAESVRATQVALRRSSTGSSCTGPTPPQPRAGLTLSWPWA